MKFITDKQAYKAAGFTIGGKAKNLFRLNDIGMNVPKWIVIPQEQLIAFVSEDVRNSKDVYSIDFIESLIIPQTFIEEVTAYFPDNKFFAVRSSAIDEDGAEFSFAGQFESYLFVTKENLTTCINKVWRSSFSERVRHYRKLNNLKGHVGIAVIVQKMIDAEAAGVAFGINPATNDREAKIISAVYGLGEGLVSGDLDADNFIYKDNAVHTRIANKSHQFVMGSEKEGGTKKIEVEKSKRELASLSEKQVRKIVDILELLGKKFNGPQDIEFATRDGEVYLLQARAITTVDKAFHTRGEYNLWDNSNIIESYPGVTTPLTFSFISKSYEGVYRLFCEFMGVPAALLKQHETVFANTLGFINGRVYYNLKTWYHMLAMLPGYSINARFMEKMMGVRERFDIPDSYRLSKSAAWWSVLKMIVSMFLRFRSLPRKRREFMRLLEDTITVYKRIDYHSKNANELMQLYLDFERKLLNEWKAPLLNDFFAMIWFGILQKRCETYRISKNPNIHNDLLCGSSDIISTQPIHRSIALATSIASNAQTKELFITHDEGNIWKILAESDVGEFAILRREIDAYISDFGERCVGELKLETISYSQDPSKFIRVLKAHVEHGVTNESTSVRIEETLRANAEGELNKTLKNKFLKKYKLKKALTRARDLVSARENLRYERTRAFGIVREIFTHMGIKFYADGVVADARDIFYLTKEEIFSYIEGKAVTQNIRSLIALRKAEFDSYRKQPPPAERFATYGPVYHSNDFFSTEKVEKITGDLKGIGCCPGIVRANVRIVVDPAEVSSLQGDILVTSSTDPGWVTLFPTAAGIIVERGSILSHSAIVSREMGKPCIVGVTGLLKTLRTGDEIEMDGSTGHIKIINRRS